MKTRHRHQDAVLIIAGMMWALRRLGASIFFPEYKLPQAHRFILVGAALGYAQLRGRPLTLASLSRNIEMPRATAARILEELELSGWVHKRGKNIFWIWTASKSQAMQSTSKRRRGALRLQRRNCPNWTFPLLSPLPGNNNLRTPLAER
jgi:hypothetical protein